MSDKTTTDRLAKNLSKLMEARGLSQRELARKAGEPVMNLNRIIGRQNEPKVGTVAKFAKALGVTVDDLLRGPRERQA